MTAGIKFLILSSPKSTCLSDLILFKLLSYYVNIIAPVVSHIINLPLTTGIFSNDLKSAFVKPLLKNDSRLE